MGTLTQLPFSTHHRRSWGRGATEAAVWGLESGLSPCPGPAGEPQLPLSAMETKMEDMEDVVAEIQHPTGSTCGSDSLLLVGVADHAGNLSNTHLFIPPSIPGILSNH